MNNLYHDIEDLLADELFRNWVKHPTAELNAHWELWISNHPDKREMMQEAKQIAARVKFSEFKPTSEIKEQILTNIKAETPDWNRSKRIDLFQPWFKIAAILVLALGLGATVFFLTQPTVNQEVAYTEHILKENPMGVRSHYILSDGTEIYLNAGSSIEFPKKFVGEERVVKLRGEAYFEVYHDPTKPFKVVANDLTVTVLGTKFNFDANAGSNSVALLEGKVRYAEKLSSSDTILAPGQMAKFDPQASSFRFSAFDEEDVIGWKDGKLVFRDASFEEVLTDLRKWYGVNIKIENESPNVNWSYTGSFSNESLETVLLNMSTVKGFDYVIARREVTISFAD